MYSKSTIKAQEQDVVLVSCVFMTNFRGVGIEDPVILYVGVIGNSDGEDFYQVKET